MALARGFAFAVVGRRDKSPPEVRLWAAVVDDAIGCATGLRGGGKVYYASAAERDAARLWLASEANEVGAFEWVCQHLSLDPSAVRARVAAQPMLVGSASRRPQS